MEFNKRNITSIIISFVLLIFLGVAFCFTKYGKLLIVAILGDNGEKCYKTFFIDFNILNKDCLQITVSKGLGYGIVVASAILKVPQIVKILSSHSVMGLSLDSFFFEVASNIPSVIFNVVMKYPFSVFGESIIILVQNVILVILYYIYGRSKTTFKYSSFFRKSFFFFGIYPVFIYYVPNSYFKYLPLIGGLCAIIGRIPQIMENKRQRHTGQLSILTWAFTALGSMARIFTTVTEVKDPIMTLSYCLSSLVNWILVFQIIFYWNRTTRIIKEQTTPMDSDTKI
ncbi:hypothetical protein WA158_004917 [Blastocystis sp. Blastoise]